MHRRGHLAQLCWQLRLSSAVRSQGLCYVLFNPQNCNWLVKAVAPLGTATHVATWSGSFEFAEIHLGHSCELNPRMGHIAFVEVLKDAVACSTSCGVLWSKNDAPSCLSIVGNVCIFHCKSRNSHLVIQRRACCGAGEYGGKWTVLALWLLSMDWESPVPSRGGNTKKQPGNEINSFFTSVPWYSYWNGLPLMYLSEYHCMWQK